MYRLMKVKSIAECSKGRKHSAILQYFQPLLNYHLSLRYLFCLFLSGRFTQVLLYVMYLRGPSECAWQLLDFTEDEECSCLAVEFLTCDRRVSCLSLIGGTVLCP